jgi:hypothetical protein
MSIITIYLLLALVLLRVRVLLPKCRRRRQPCSHITAAFHLAFSTLAHTLARLKQQSLPTTRTCQSRLLRR